MMEPQTVISLLSPDRQMVTANYVLLGSGTGGDFHGNKPRPPEMEESEVRQSVVISSADVESQL